MLLHNTLALRGLVTTCAMAICLISTGCGGGGSNSEVAAVAGRSVGALQKGPISTTSNPLVVDTGTLITTAAPDATQQPLAKAADTVAAKAATSAQPPAIATSTTAVAAAGSLPSAAGLADWLHLAQPATNSAPSRLVTAIAEPHIIAFVSPTHVFPRRNIGLQCQGTNATLADVPALMQKVETSSGGQQMQRFGAAGTVDRPVFRLELGATDILPAGISPRCELLSYPMPGSALPANETFWFSVSFWVDDWRGAGDELTIGQMHIQDSRNILLNPFLALVVHGNELRVELRHNPLQTPNQATTTVVSTTRMTLPTRRWFTAVIHARLDDDPIHAPFFKMWLDDTQVVDYHGPWGYVLQADAAAYAKVGLYHWLNGNPWDNKHPTRSMMVGSMLLARDSAQGYARTDLAAAVAAPIQ